MPALNNADRIRPTPPQESTEMDLPDELIALLRGTATCYIATTMPDGSPQLTQTWSTPTARTS